MVFCHSNIPSAKLGTSPADIHLRQARRKESLEAAAREAMLGQED